MSDHQIGATNLFVTVPVTTAKYEQQDGDDYISQHSWHEDLSWIEIGVISVLLPLWALERVIVEMAPQLAS